MKTTARILKIVCPIIVSILLNSCVKTTVSENSGRISIDKIQRWLDHIKFTKPLQSDKITVLQSNLKFDEMRLEQHDKTENILVIPISDIFKKQVLGTVNEQGKTNLLLGLNDDGEVAYGQVVFFHSIGNSIKKTDPGYSTFNFGNPIKGVADGKYSFYSVFGARLKELTFVNGLLREQGILSPINSNQTNDQINTVKVNSGICTQWYLVTTYYDESGNVTGQTSQYLFTTGVCDGSIPQGEYQVPQQEQNVGSEELDRTALNIFDTNPYIPGNDTTKVRGSVYLHGSYGLFDAATWQGSMGIKLTPNWIYMETSGYAKFVTAPAPLATASYIGAIVSPTNSSFPVGTTITYTYAQAFHL